MWCSGRAAVLVVADSLQPPGVTDVDGAARLVGCRPALVQRAIEAGVVSAWTDEVGAVLLRPEDLGDWPPVLVFAEQGAVATATLGDTAPHDGMRLELPGPTATPG